MNINDRNLDIEDLLDEMKNGHNVDYTKELCDPRAILDRWDIENRVIYIYDIDEYLVDDCVKLLLKYDRDDKDIPVDQRKRVLLVIRSDGGNLSTCLLILSTIKCMKTPVDCLNLGVACSAGAYIFLAGENRYLLPQSLTLLHRGSAQQAGEYSQILGQTEHYKKEQEFLENFVLERSNISRAVLRRKLKTDWYISNEECLKYGFATKEIQSLDELY